jgi:hypothetical protein
MRRVRGVLIFLASFPEWGCPDSMSFRFRLAEHQRRNIFRKQAMVQSETVATGFPEKHLFFASQVPARLTSVR